MATRTALYLRSSKDRHDVSVESQRRELRAFAEANSLLVVAEFVDKVESAKTANRPAFQDMVAEVKSSKCRFAEILCFDTSRFSRRQYDAQMYKHLLKKKGVGLRFLKLPKTDPLMDSVLESLMEVFDEFHSQKSKVDGLRGMRENIIQGYRAGGPAPYGYKLEKHVVGTRDGDPITKSTLVPDPMDAPTVKAYLEARATGESRKSASRRLNIDKKPNTLLYLEGNALVYAGHTVWNRHNERVEGSYVGGTKFRDPSEWITNRDTHEAIISDETANAVLAMQSGRTRASGRQRNNDYVMSGLLKCDCGAPMYGNSGFYRCRDRCGSSSIKRETVDEMVVNTLLDDLLTEDAVSLLAKMAQDRINRAPKQKDDEATAVGAEMDELDKEIAKLVELLTKVEHQRALLNRLDELEGRRGKLEARATALQKAKPKQLIDAFETVQDFLDEFRNGLADDNGEKRKLVVKSLIGEAQIAGDELRLIPSEQFTGFKMAFPGGFEPPLPP